MAVKRSFGAFSACLATYGLVSLTLYGSVLKPLAGPFLLPRALWLDGVLGAVVLSMAGVLYIWRREGLRWLLPSFVTFSFLVLPPVGAAFKAERARQEALVALGADTFVEKPFFWSMRNAPREYQFELHMAALKDCVPYGWSYRELDFYLTPKAAAVNVLPQDWLEKCPDIRD